MLTTTKKSVLLVLSLISSGVSEIGMTSIIVLSIAVTWSEKEQPIIECSKSVNILNRNIMQDIPAYVITHWTGVYNEYACLASSQDTLRLYILGLIFLCAPKPYGFSSVVYEH